MFQYTCCCCGNAFTAAGPYGLLAGLPVCEPCTKTTMEALFPDGSVEFAPSAMQDMNAVVINGVSYAVAPEVEELVSELQSSRAQAEVEVKRLTEAVANNRLHIIRMGGVIIDAKMAIELCLSAEMARREKLLPGAPASTYCEKRIARLEQVLAMIEGEK